VSDHKTWQEIVASQREEIERLREELEQARSETHDWRDRALTAEASDALPVGLAFAIAELVDAAEHVQCFECKGANASAVPSYALRNLRGAIGKVESLRATK
jgi:hypothetical protein